MIPNIEGPVTFALDEVYFDAISIKIKLSAIVLINPPVWC